jgi:hypothetical protein
MRVRHWALLLAMLTVMTRGVEARTKRDANGPKPRTGSSVVEVVANSCFENETWVDFDGQGCAAYRANATMCDAAYERMQVVNVRAPSNFVVRGPSAKRECCACSWPRAWMTLAVRFDAVANTIDILKDGRQIVDPTPCAVDGIGIDPADRYISLPLVGKSHWADDTASHIGLGGLVVVEGYLSEDEAMGAGNQLLEGTLSDELPHFDGAAHNVLYAAPSSGVRDSPADTCARPSFCKFPFTYQGRGYAQCTMHSNAGVFWYVFPGWLRTGRSSFLQA